MFRVYPLARSFKKTDPPKRPNSGLAQAVAGMPAALADWQRLQQSNGGRIG